MNPTVQGNPKIRFEKTATATASTKQGMNVALTTIPLSLERATGSSSSPAINNITVRQICLRVRDMKGSDQKQCQHQIIFHNENYFIKSLTLKLELA